MSAETGGSHLNLIHETFRAQQQEIEFEHTLKTFRRKTSELIWTYCPSIYLKKYNWKNFWPHLDPGVASIPSVSFPTPTGEILIHVEGVYEEVLEQPNDTRLSKIGVFFGKDAETSSLVVEYDEEGEPIKDTLPSVEELQKGIEVLDYMIGRYLASDIVRAPKGYSGDHP